MAAEAVVAAAAGAVVGPAGEAEARSAHLHLNQVGVETARGHAVRAADVVVVADARVAKAAVAPVHGVVAAASPAPSRLVESAAIVAIGAEEGPNS
jgi:hypothetical protein